jgi:hypothetical protein
MDVKIVNETPLRDIPCIIGNVLHITEGDMRRINQGYIFTISWIEGEDQHRDAGIPNKIDGTVNFVKKYHDVRDYYDCGEYVLEPPKQGRHDTSIYFCGKIEGNTFIYHRSR